MCAKDNKEREGITDLVHQASRQLAFPLSHSQTSYQSDQFVVSEANKTQFTIAHSWFLTIDPALIICGPRYSGKTHLAHLVSDQCDGIFLNAAEYSKIDDYPEISFIDNAEDIEPKKFLMAFESMISRGGRLVLIGRGLPDDWSGELGDLRTRLRALPRVTMQEPDEKLIRAIIKKSFLDRQIEVENDVIDYAAKRLPCTFAASYKFVEYADQLALSAGRPITKPFVQSFLEKI